MTLPIVGRRSLSSKFFYCGVRPFLNILISKNRANIYCTWLIFVFALLFQTFILIFSIHELAHAISLILDY